MLLLALFSFIQVSDQSTQDVEAWPREAEAAYTNGDYRQSAQLYQQIVDAGIQRSEIYFNLGNAYFQLHDLGRALVNYRRAEQYAPRDDDLKLNMARIRTQRVDSLGDYAALAAQITNSLTGVASNSEFEMLLLLLWWIFCGLGIVYALLPTWRRYVKLMVIAAGILMVFIGVLEGVRFVADATYPPAVVVTEMVSVMSGPDTAYMEIFELHAAAEIRIIEQRNDWVRIQLPDLEEGWIQSGAVEKV
jgi:tetratricopeptide (TPR) repeat protein